MDKRERDLVIRTAYRDEWQDTMRMVWKTFVKFEAPVYPKEGVRNFNDFITDETLYRMFLMGEYQMFIAKKQEEIVGAISLRTNNHISLLFVDEIHHRQGIGSALVEYIKNYLVAEVGLFELTVNASPYGLPFYDKLGFKNTGNEEMKDGIIYTPMKLYL